MITVYTTNKGREAQAELKDFVFPGGEVQVVVTPAKLVPVRNISNEDYALIDARLENADDIMKLFLVTDAVRRLGLKIVKLYMPYVPYARQDRAANQGEAHALKVFANLINSQKYDEVIVLDPHSDVVEACFENLTINKNHEFVSDVIGIQNRLRGQPGHYDQPFWLVAPDAGAMKKIGALASFLVYDYSTMKIAQGGKSRDTVTGKLTGFTVDKEDLEGLPCIIVDDICDGGGTFLGLADVLKAKNAGPLTLVVTHGIFSQGFDKLLEKFDKIYCSNSFMKNLPEQLHKNVVVLAV